MKLLCLMLVTLLSYSALAYETGIIEIADDHKVYYRYKEAQNGAKTLVLLNGLIYAIENWDEYVQELADSDVGVLQLAYSTQPESLRALEGVTPYYSKLQFNPLFGWMQAGLEIQDLVDETMVVVDTLEIDRFSLVALSYGSIIATELAVQQKDRIDDFLLFAPAVMTSGRYNPYGASRHRWYEGLVAAGNLYADYSYDAEIGNTLALLVTPNRYMFEGVEFLDFFSGVYQMARSTKWFDLKDYAKSELPPTTMFLATLEEGALYKDQMLFWEMMEDNKAKQSLVIFEGSYHAIPGVAPEAAAEVTLQAIDGSLSAEQTVKVGTGNPPSTTRESLVDFTDLTSENWGAAE
jgi:pimeloyl-ACP methyl ester carboxylesterase